MSSRVVTPLRTRRFRTSIAAVASAVLLAGAIQSLVLAAQQPLRSWIFSTINNLIDRGHFDVYPIPNIGVLWIVAAFNLVLGIFSLGFGLAIAIWTYRKPGP